MKILHSSIFRAVCSLIIGALLIKYPSDTATWIVVLIGVLFLLSGIISCVAYFFARRHSANNVITTNDGRVISASMPSYPVLGLGSLLLGLILALRPSAVIDIMAYVLGAILIVGAITQMANLLTAHRLYRIPFLYWISPLLIFLVGLMSFVKPEWIAGAPLLVLGWCLVLYGVTEVVNAVKIYSARRKYAKEQNASVAEIEDITQ